MCSRFESQMPDPGSGVIVGVGVMVGSGVSSKVGSGVGLDSVVRVSDGGVVMVGVWPSCSLESVLLESDFHSANYNNGRLNK